MNVQRFSALRNPRSAIRVPQSALRNRNGVALVIILAFIVLITGLVVAFFSATMSQRQVSNSSANQAKADFFAQGAMDAIVGDLKQEIADGSTATTVGTTTIYLPLSSTNAVPQLVGSTGAGGLENLVKRSATGLAFSKGANPRASGLSTLTPSQNGRFVTAASWNKPLLMPPTSATDYTPLLTSGAFPVPDWILVARDGSNPTAWNPNLVTSPTSPNSVVGRYAYTVYDEGGLIDVNVAGYPLTGNPPYSSSNSDPQSGYKGKLAFADLTRLPGISAMTAAKQKTVINSLAGWRNYASAQPAGTLADGFTFASGTGFTDAVLSSTNGFLKTSNRALFNGQSDRMFLSRQELIRFFLQSVASSASDTSNLQTALRYLTHFSRELNAPSWSPSTPAGSTIDYAANANSSAAANRNLANVRDSAGKPLIKQRFPLSRIALLSKDSRGSDDDILKYFGLRVKSGTGYSTVWEYDHGSPSTIKTLDEVKTLGREPDFFELLKAAILKGSLGLSAGPQASGSAVNSGTVCVEDDSKLNTDAQIIQIGANILDQYDADSYPTAIYFAVPGLANALSGYEPRHYHYGVENLPYIYRLNVVGVGVADPVAGTLWTGLTNRSVTVFIQPELWNLHQSTGTNPDKPTEFRIQALGTATAAIKSSTVSSGAPIAEDKGPPVDFSTTTDILDPIQGTAYDVGKVDFSTASQTFLNPTPLFVETGASSPNPANVLSGLGNPGFLYKGSAKMSQSNGRQYEGKDMVGFNCGTAMIGNTTPANTSNPFCVGGALRATSVSFAVLYKGEDKDWHPYSFIYKINDGAGTSACTAVGDCFMVADPRTRRLAVQGTNPDWAGYPGTSLRPNAGAGQAALWGAPSTCTFIPAGATNAKRSLYLGLLSSNTATPLGGAAAYYSDKDGIVRPGDTIFSTDAPTAGLDGCAFATPTTGTESRRPLVLNRPFRSVGELGYAFRDLPGKTLDFFSTSSGDAALLDVFSVDDAEVTAGRININTRNKEVIQAMLSSGIKREADPAVVISDDDSAALAEKIVAWTSDPTKGPLLNRAELVTKLADELGNAPTAIADKKNKTHREAAVRALADVSNTRTWNLLIDVIAQTGRFPASATALDKFVVEGERRYWLHLAIDRFTGEIVDKQLETVTQ